MVKLIVKWNFAFYTVREPKKKDYSSKPRRLLEQFSFANIRKYELLTFSQIAGSWDVERFRTKTVQCMMRQKSVGI